MNLNIKHIALCAAAAIGLGACSTEMPPEPSRLNSDGLYTYELQMNATIQEFDSPNPGEESRRTSILSRTIYVLLKLADGKSIWGTASSDSDGCTLELVEALPASCQGGTVSCWYVPRLDQTITASTENLGLSIFDAVYTSDGEDQFTVLGEGVVAFDATLSPNIPRFKFKSSSPDTNFYLRGPSFPDRISMADKTSYLSQVEGYFNVSNSSNEGGYQSSYIYGYFFEDDDKELRVHDVDRSRVFVKDYSNHASFLSVGRSGYVTLPTPNDHEGWIMDTYRTTSNGNYTTYGNVEELAPEENTFYFHQLCTLQSAVSIRIDMSFETTGVFSGTEATKKQAQLHVQVYDSADMSGAPIDFGGWWIYNTDDYTTNTEYTINGYFDLDENITAAGPLTYKVSVLTDGVSVRVNRFNCTNF